MVPEEARCTGSAGRCGQQWIRNDIDRFILSKLEAKESRPVTRSGQANVDPPGHATI